MPPRLFIFECSNDTYLGCVEKSVFGSNKPWPLQVARGDVCLLHHYDAGAVFALWRAETPGGRNLVPKAWGGKFPFQVKVALMSPKIIEVPKAVLAEFKVDPAAGRYENVVEAELAARVVQALTGGGYG